LCIFSIVHWERKIKGGAMKHTIISLFLFSSVLFAQSYNNQFYSSTMRVDYYRIATKGEEHITLDAVYEEPLWAGSRTALIDTMNLGDNFFTVQDYSSKQVIFSRGFCTLSAEWQTTEEAMSTWRTFHETVRFPFPKEKIILTFFKRDSIVGEGKPMVFRRLQEFTIDPNDSVFIRRDCTKRKYKVLEIANNGSVDNKVDLLILGDGYSASDMGKFRKDAQHYTNVLFSVYPFRNHKKDFNVRALEVISEESGIDKPDIHVWKKTALGTHYNTFGSVRYILTEDNRTLRDIAGTVPYDFITILVNDNRYGGGGIFNLYTTSFTTSAQKGQEWEVEYVFVHEFGHCFAGLGDEYYSSQISYIDFYPHGVEPWEPNLSRTADRNTIKWKEFIDNDTPVPTPWGKEQYDSLETLRAKLDRRDPDYYQKREVFLSQTKIILANPKLINQVGAFEGAGYLPYGMYRPALDCKMFSLNPVDFDPVCAAAIERMIEQFTK